MTVDFTKFNFEEIFGVAKSLDSKKMKSKQRRPLRAEILERAIAEYSGGQLHYVGDLECGKDFVFRDEDYESKGKDGIFCKRIPWTKKITLKNTMGNNNTSLPNKTFDYMLLWDTTNYSLGVCTWESCMKNAWITNDSVNFKVHFDDIEFIVKNVIPTHREDFGDKLDTMILSAIK